MKRTTKIVPLALIVAALLTSSCGCNSEYNREHNHEYNSEYNSEWNSENGDTQPACAETEPAQIDYSQIENLPDCYKEILDNKKPFHLHGEKLLIEQYKSPYSQKHLALCDSVEYSVLDMDGDGNVELLIKGWYGDILVLHEENGDVYGYDFIFRTMYYLKSDGSFSWNARAGKEYGVSKLKLEDNECMWIDLWHVEHQEDGSTKYYVNESETTEQNFQAFIAQRNEEEPEWYPLDRYPLEGFEPETEGSKGQIIL